MANHGILVKGVSITTPGGKEVATFNVSLKDISVSFTGTVELTVKIDLQNTFIVDRDAMQVEIGQDDVFIPFVAGTNKLPQIAANTLSFSVLPKPNPAAAKILDAGNLNLEFSGGKVGPGAGN